MQLCQKHFHGKALKYRYFRTPPSRDNTVNGATKNKGNGEQGNHFVSLLVSSTQKASSEKHGGKARSPEPSSVVRSSEEGGSAKYRTFQCIFCMWYVKCEGCRTVLQKDVSLGNTKGEKIGPHEKIFPSQFLVLKILNYSTTSQECSCNSFIP